MRLQLRLLTLMTLALCGCKSTGKDFVVPPAPDARVDLDLGISSATAALDMTCFNSVCGGCSQWANYDGKPSKEGDPCLWNGVYKCAGTQLECTSNTCLGCSSGSNHATGTVCGADGHTIIELHYSGTACVAYDFGSAIDVCNHSANDICQQKCTANGTTYDCAAHCASDDGGGTGCTHQPTDTCESLTSC
jgi:hypothetical protein